MSLPNIEIAFQNIVNTVTRHKEEARNPKFQIDQEFDMWCQLITEDGVIPNYCTIRIKIKDSRYSIGLESNWYTVIILDSEGQVEKYATEKELEDLVINY